VHGPRSPHDAICQTRTLAGYLLAPAAAAVLLLCAPRAMAASYVPGQLEDELPTDTASRTEAPQALPTADSIQWALAPLQYAGSVSLEGRWLRLEDGSRARHGLVFNDIEFATYVWQPWFIQLRAGLGILAAFDRSGSIDGSSSSSNSTAVTGRFTMAVFPVSRFPFELRADVSDSRARGDTLGPDYRTHRFSITQAYRPETGNDSYNLNLEYSRLLASDGSEDTVRSVRGTALRQLNEHSYEVSGQLTLNELTNSDSRSRVAMLAARHTYHPARSLHVDTLATWNDVQLQSGNAPSRLQSATNIYQLSSFATWHPREGEWLYSPTAPLYLTGSMRLADTGTESSGVAQRGRALNASIGVSQELSREWRLASSISANLVNRDNAQNSTLATGSASVTYTPEGLLIGTWRYTPTLGVTLGLSRSSESGHRSTLSSQLAHGVSRNFVLGEANNVSLSLTQSAGVLKDSQTQELSRALAHSAALSWQGGGSDASQSYVGLSASDSRTWERGSGRFQLVNLQVSRRTQLSRHTNWSGNLTTQASRSDNTQVDAFTGTQRSAEPGWQRYSSGSLSYENQRLFGVPQLRFTTLLAVNTQQLESRSAGDIDAPRERITKSLESRLDYSIGRLETRLSARLARVDGRSVASLFVRVQRNY
jgi:hypothetical protein